MKRPITLIAAGVLLAGPTVLMAAAPAQAEPEKHARGTVAGARYDISVEKERGRFDADADLEGVAAGSRWKMVVRHDGRRVGARTARAVRDDGRFEVDFREVRSADTAGRDVFKVTLKRTDGAGKVTRKLVFRR